MNLEQEVKTVIEDSIERGQIIPATWLTQTVVSHHPNITGEDTEWYQVCAYGHVRSIVGKCVRYYKVSTEEPDEQLLLPGYERVQKAYSTERAGEQVIVPVGQLTDSEIDTKSGELRAMGMGCFQHADELQRYKNQRVAAA